jgi:hypothetical protein
MTTKDSKCSHGRIIFKTFDNCPKCKPVEQGKSCEVCGGEMIVCPCANRECKKPFVCRNNLFMKCNPAPLDGVKPDVDVHVHFCNGKKFLLWADHEAAIKRLESFIVRQRQDINSLESALKAKEEEIKLLSNPDLLKVVESLTRNFNEAKICESQLKDKDARIAELSQSSMQRRRYERGK